MIVGAGNVLSVFIVLIVIFFGAGVSIGAPGPKFKDGGNKHNLSSDLRVLSYPPQRGAKHSALEP